MLTASPGNSEQGQPIPVTTAPLSKIAFYPTHSAPATAVSLNDTQVSAEISGLLNGVLVSVGDHVGAGDIVAEVDCRDAEISVAEANAAYKAARAKYRFNVSQLNKAKRLAKNKNISADEIDRRSSNLAISEADSDRLKASLNKAQVSVERCTITAPFDAVVTERLASIGDFLQRGQPILRLLDIKNIEVSANIQEKDLASFNQADGVEFVTRTQSYPVRLRTTLPQMDSRLRSFEARLSFVEDPAVAGSAGRLLWRSSSTYLPADLVVDRGGLGLFIMQGNRAQFVPLSNAVAGLPVATALDLTTHVIIEGRYNLNDGDSVIESDL